MLQATGSASSLPGFAKLTECRQEFLGQLREFVDQLDHRIEEIDSLIAAAAKNNPRSGELYRDVWRPKLDAFRNELEHSRGGAICVRRSALWVSAGQGKTTLLQNWLGQNSGHGGLKEISYLPTGQVDTTAALVRLTMALDGPGLLSPGYLHVKLLGAKDLRTSPLNARHCPNLSAELPDSNC